MSVIMNQSSIVQPITINGIKQSIDIKGLKFKFSQHFVSVNLSAHCKFNQCCYFMIIKDNVNLFVHFADIYSNLVKDDVPLDSQH